MNVDNNKIIPDFDKHPIVGLKINLHLLDNDIIVISLIGYIDTYNTVLFQDKVDKIFKKYKKIIFDLSGINYISSTGIGSFIHFLKVLKPINGQFVLVNVQSKVQDVFQLLGFTSFFTFVGNYEQAVKILNEKNEKNEIFPTTIKCPICLKKLKVKKSGKYRCPECKQILYINDEAIVSL